MEIEEAVKQTENDRTMQQGHGVYESVSNYTQNVVPHYKLWPGRSKSSTPVAEIEVWLKSMPLDVTFHPPFLVSNGRVKSKIERMIHVRNATNYRIQVTMEDITEEPIPVICKPSCFTVEPYGDGLFWVTIYNRTCGQVKRMLNGTITLPFESTPCAIPVMMKSTGPFLEILTPTLNFSLVPLKSETVKTAT